MDTTLSAAAHLRRRNYIWLVLILALASYFRFFVGIKWDDGLLLHPDERFLTMVGEKVRLPHSILEYLDSSLNPLSPYNNGYDYYVYGNLPLTIVRVVAEIVGKTSYDSIYVVGRYISGVFDLASIVGVYVLGELLFSSMTGLFGAMLLACCVQNIQLSRFMGTENIVGAFVLWTTISLVLSQKAFSVQQYLKARLYLCVAGTLLGLALASKISAIFFVPAVAIAMAVTFFLGTGDYLDKSRLRPVWFELWIGAFLLFTFPMILTVRIAQPSIFSGLTFNLSPQFLDNMRRIKELTDGGEWPPNVQFAGRTPVLFSLTQVMQWEMGYGLFFLTTIGCIVATVQGWKNKRFGFLFISGWALFFLGYQSTRFVIFGRYLSIVYPFFACLAGYAVEWAFVQSKKVLAKTVVAVLLLAAILWGFAFNTIYFDTHSRIQASRWIYENIPQGSTILNEAWDDGLPLRVDNKDGFGGLYTEKQINFYELDTDKKRGEILHALESVDYIILSSNRQFASIPRMVNRYPFTAKYYQMLFSGELGFSRVYSKVVTPSLFGFEIQDKNAGESFTVYDHPAVYIFKKNPDFNRGMVESILQDFPNGVFEPVTTATTKEISWLP